MHTNVFATLFLLAALLADASQITEKPNIKGRKFPFDICPSLAQPGPSIRFDPAKYTTGKSPYPIPNPQQQQSTRSGCPGCVLHHLHLITRHGTRYPTEGNLYSTILLEAKLQHANPTDPAFQWVKSWKSPMDPAKNGALNEVGWDDLRKLGRRDQERYAPLLNYTPQLGEQIDFRATAIQRSQDSGDAYLEAIFGKGNPNTPKKVVLPRKEDPEMRPWEMCPKYQLGKVSPEMLAMKKSREADFMQKTTKRIAGILGLKCSESTAEGTKKVKDNSVLEPKDVASMYTICMSSVSMCFQKGQFCNIFTEEEMRTLNYYKDMTYWYVHGPGNQVNVDMSGPLIAAIRNEMNAAIANPAGKKFHLRFNHAETVMRLYNGMFIFDQPQPQTEAPNSFKQSRDLPFMGNVHFELWRRGGPNNQPPMNQPPMNFGPPMNQPPMNYGPPMKYGPPTKYGAPMKQPPMSYGPPMKYKPRLERRANVKRLQQKYEKAAVKQQYKTGGPMMQQGPMSQQGNFGPSGQVQYFVRMLVNERPRQIKGCTQMFCPFNEFLQATEKIASMNLAQACKLSPEEDAKWKKLGEGKKKGKKGAALDQNEKFKNGDTGTAGKPLDLSEPTVDTAGLFGTEQQASTDATTTTTTATDATAEKSTTDATTEVTAEKSTTEATAEQSTTDAVEKSTDTTAATTEPAATE
jgi:hypothetical protein